MIQRDQPMSQKDLAAFLGVDADEVLRLARDPAFPRPSVAGAGVPRWDAAEIQAWRDLRWLHKRWVAVA